MPQMKTSLLIATLLTCGFTATTTLGQEMSGKDKANAKEKLPVCPITGETVDFSVKTMTDEGPVYFCCPGCIKTFEKSPQKYADQVAAQRKALAKLPKVQVTCPVTGEPVNEKVFVEHDGEKVYFCCGGCKPKYEKDPTKYAAKLADSYTYQTHCPVMGGKIDPTVFTDLPTGQRVYYCCPGCEGPFLKDPAKYAPKLAAQGTNINVEKLKKALAKEHAGKP